MRESSSTVGCRRPATMGPRSTDATVLPTATSEGAEDATGVEADETDARSVVATAGRCGSAATASAEAGSAR